MGWLIRLLLMARSWLTLKSTVLKTKCGIDRAASFTAGIQQKHTERTMEQALGGDPEANYELGERAYEGRGLPCDYQVAAQWFAKAADLGHAKAQSVLGMMFLIGRGVPQDLVKARFYLSQAAEQGDEPAVKNLEKLDRKETPQ